MDYLTIRHQLKEDFRAKIRKENGNDPRRKDESSSNDGYGTFFGPSEVVFTGRVMAEYKSYLETSKTTVQQLHKRLNLDQSGNGGDSKQLLFKKLEHVEKVEKIRESRDYSFLLSGDHPGSTSVPVQEKKEKKLSSENPKPVGIKEKRPSNVVKVPVGIKEKRSSNVTNVPVGIKEKRSNNVMNVPVGMKEKRSSNLMNVPVGIKEKRSSNVMNAPSKKPKVVVVGEHKDSRTNSCDLKKSLGKKRKIEETNTVVHKKAKKQKQPRVVGGDIAEGEDLRSIIRSIFRYDPSKYHDDRDDKNMQASFEDIQREERRSAKLARKEDAEELKKLEQEKKKTIVKIKLR